MPQSLSNVDTIAFLGFGEAAQAFLSGWRTIPEFASEVVGFDIKTNSPDNSIRLAKQADFVTAGAVGATNAPEALAPARAVFSLVTADQAEAAALAALPGLREGAFYFDGNSCAPQTKIRIAERVEAARGRYVDLAIMAPVHPRKHRTPTLVSGPHAEEAAPLLRSLDMSATIYPGAVGAASSVKMIRSVMVKGLEALVCECVLAGRRAGVDATVLETLDETFPGFDWKARSAYMLERVMTHGVRRAAEMREVAITVDGFGLQGDMARAIVEWQQRVGDLQLKAKDADPDDYRALADMILARLTPPAE